MRPHLHWCSALALSPDASMLATSDNTDVRVWRCDELLASSPAAALPRCSAVMLLISERADRVARLEYEGDLRVYEFSSGRHIKTHAGFGRPYLGDRSIDGAERYCTASSDGRRIATVDWDGLHVLDIVDDRTYRIFFEGQDEHDPSLLESMRLNSDGSILVVRHWSLDVDEIAWEVETGDRVPVPGVDHQQPVWHAQAAERIALFSDFVSGAAAVWHAEVEIDVATITSDARAAVATSDGAISMLQLRLGGLPS